MNDYILVLRPTRLEMLSGEPTDDEKRLVGEHFERIKAAHAEGRVKFVGRTMTNGPETIGVAVFAAESQAEAEEWAAHDPCVLGGIMTGEVMPFRIVFGGQAQP